MNLSSVRHRVFLVDDQPCVLFGIEAMLQSRSDLGIVGTAGTGKSALEGIRRTRPDLVVVELSLADNEGVKLIEDIHQMYPATKTLLLTVQEDIPLIQQAIDAGASGFVAKSSAVSDLLHAIRAVLSGGIYLEPRLAGRFITEPDAAIEKATASLSARELEVIKQVARGYSNKEISTGLHLSIKTIETYRARALDKLGTGTRSKLMEVAMREGWLVF